MDKDRKQVSVSSLKCNNINVNVNGLELDVFPQFLGGGLAADGTSDASSFAGNAANGGSEINDFRFICINNNNNTVVELPQSLTCEECFREFLTDAVTDAEIEQFSISLEELCVLLVSEGISKEQFVSDLVAELGVPLERANNLAECLIEAGIEFSTGLPG